MLLVSLTSGPDWTGCFLSIRSAYIFPYAGLAPFQDTCTATRLGWGASVLALVQSLTYLDCTCDLTESGVAGSLDLALFRHAGSIVASQGTLPSAFPEGGSRERGVPGLLMTRTSPKKTLHNRVANTAFHKSRFPKTSRSLHAF